MLIRETEEFIEKVLRNSSYHLAFNVMNDSEAQELNGICENIMSESTAEDYSEAYELYRKELKSMWGSVKDLKESYRIPSYYQETP